MRIPSLQELDDIRKTGFRPQVVACFLNNNKILFLYKKEYDLWQFPQGGIDNRESIKEAVAREMKEELGNDFVGNIEMTKLVGRNKIEFSSDKWGSRELATDDDQKILMKGKEYFFVILNSDSKKLDISKTEFDDYKWLDYEGALEITKTIYQKGKKRITDDLLNVLHLLGLL